MNGQERPVIIAGNWKMHKTRAEAVELSKTIRNAVAGEKDLPVVVLCPPFTSLEAALSSCEKSEIQIGAQNMEHRDSGAFTGEVSPLMLKDLGVSYVIIGHSERRQLFGETNTSVNLKFKAALKHKLVAIVCVGETLDERESNLTDAVVSRQVAAALDDVDAADLKTLVIAYEPVWAIGTGKVCEADEANRVCKLIRATVGNLYGNKSLSQSIPILYGGSVKPSNIDEQLAQSDIDGSLVGGASLNAEEFLALVKSGQKKVGLAASRS